MPKEITDLDAFEVSFVRSPANKRKFLLFKSEGVGENNMIKKEVQSLLDLPLAPRGRDWNGDQAESRVRQWATENGEVDFSRYFRAFFWRNEDDPELFGSYKLGYADVINGELTAVPRGIFAVAAVLQGARGGVDLGTGSGTVDDVKDVVSDWYARMREEFEDESIIPPWEEEMGMSKNKGVKKSMDYIKELLKKEAEGEQKIIKSISGSDDVKKAVQGAFRILNEYKDGLKEEDFNHLASGLGIKKQKETRVTKDSIDDLNVSHEVKAQLKELWKSNETMAQQLKKEIEEKHQREFLAKAEQFDRIPNTTAKDLAEVLKSFSSIDEKNYAKLEGILKSANEALSNAAIFQEIGGNGSGLAGSNSYSKIEKMAEPIMKEENVSREQAISKVLEKHPELYADYINESESRK